MSEGSKLAVAIVHYHLQRGGVSHVVEMAERSLSDSNVEVLILSGEEASEEIAVTNVAVVPGLGYRKTGNSIIAHTLTKSLREKAVAYFGREPDVWHFHNPTLGKNVLMPFVIQELASHGARVLLQIHDFAEDGRPNNYSAQRSSANNEAHFKSVYYPKGSHIHYAVINQRDRKFLKKLGVPDRQLHLTPNPIERVEMGASMSERPFQRDRLFALYPVRGIRRKNLGELILLAQCYGDRMFFGTTLVPENPEWIEIHEKWRDLIEQLDLPVELGMAGEGGYRYQDLLGWSDFVVTASVAEGFGLAFLEPWLIGKAVVGRDLPEVTEDFRSQGLSFSGLYQRIGVPLDWLDEEKLRAEAQTALQNAYLAYDCPVPRGAMKQVWGAWVIDGKIDFGVLSESFQKEVILRIHSDPTCLDELDFPSFALASGAEKAAYQSAIESAYSLAAYGTKLEGVYQRVKDSRVGNVKAYPPQRLLRQFLDPARFNLLRV